MSLGENLQFLRKKENITQEQLAEKLEVSRQSVSKWESDTTYPEMDKLLQICEIFRCSMDDLVRKDISVIYVEDKAQYDAHMNRFSKRIALGVGLILFGICVSQFLQIGMPPEGKLMTAVFLIFLIIAVAIFIVAGMQHSEFERKNPYIEEFYTEEEIDRFNRKFPVMVVTGVVLILVGMIVSSLGEGGLQAEKEFADSLFFLFISVAVPILVYAGIQKGKFDIKEYNAIHNKETEEYKRNRLLGAACGCIMMAAFILYLICALAFHQWGMPTVIIFPVFGILYGIVSVVLNMKK